MRLGTAIQGIDIGDEVGHLPISLDDLNDFNFVLERVTGFSRCHRFGFGWRTADGQAIKKEAPAGIEPLRMLSILSPQAFNILEIYLGKIREHKTFTQLKCAVLYPPEGFKLKSPLHTKTHRQLI